MSLPFYLPTPEQWQTTAQPDRDAETQEGFVSWIRREFTRRMDERRLFEQMWLLNLAFIEGNHYAEIHRTTGEVFVPERRFPWEQRDAFNHIAPTFETRIAKLTRMRPMLSVRPGSPEETDVSASKVATKLIHYNWEEQRADSLIAEGSSWAEATGTAFLKSIWNPAKGTALPDQMGVSQGIAIGDIETVVVPPFEMLPETVLKARLEDQRSIMHCKAWPKDSDHIAALKEVYRQRTGADLAVDSEDVTSVTLGRGTAMQNGLPSLRFAVLNLKESCVVIEFYERPSRKYPRGRFAIVIGSDLVHYGSLPYDHLDFPFAKVDSIRRPNSFWSKSVIDRLIPVQRRYNTVRNRIAEYLNRVGIGQWVAEENTVDIDLLTNEPGLVIEHSRGSRPPAPVQFPSLPSTFMDELQTLTSEFMQISGVHEVSHAQLPQGAGGSPSGILVQQLQEQDDTRVATTQRYLDEACEKMGKQWLQLYQQNVSERREFPVMGRNQSVHILAFDATTIRSYNVKVEASSALSASPAARRDMAFALLDRGLFNDPQTGKLSPAGMQKIFQLLEVGDWENWNEDRALPETRALWENNLMSLGQPVQVWPWEDHLIHTSVHNRFRQSEEFYKLLESPEGPLIAQMVDDHVNGHLAAIQGAFGGMAPAQPGMAPEAGAGGPPPGAAGPPPNAGPPPGGPTPPPSGTGPSDEEMNMEQIAREAMKVEATSGPEAADAFVLEAVRRGGL